MINMREKSIFQE